MQVRVASFERLNNNPGSDFGLGLGRILPSRVMGQGTRTKGVAFRSPTDAVNADDVESCNSTKQGQLYNPNRYPMVL